MGSGMRCEGSAVLVFLFTRYFRHLHARPAGRDSDTHLSLKLRDSAPAPAFA